LVDGILTNLCDVGFVWFIFGWFVFMTQWRPLRTQLQQQSRWRISAKRESQYGNFA